MQITLDDIDYPTLEAAQPHFATARKIVVCGCPLLTELDSSQAIYLDVWNCPLLAETGDTK